MTATAEKLAPESTRPSIAAHEENLRRWQSKIASLGEEMAKAEAELEALETKAAKAALEGQPLPDMADVASKARALKRARAMAAEQAQQAEQELAEARREEAEAARRVLAAEMVQKATAFDDTLAELGHRLAELHKLGRKEAELARLAGQRRRRGSLDIGPTALAGTLMHHSPELLEALGSPRPPHDQRRPLAPVLASRLGMAPYLEEVTT